MTVPFASVSDLESRWRPLSTDEQARATVLLGDASDLVREAWPDLDARVASGEVMPSTVTRVVVGVVKRSMMSGDLSGFKQVDQSAGPFSTSFEPVNPNGDMYLSAADKVALGHRVARRAFAVDLSGY